MVEVRQVNPYHGLYLKDGIQYRLSNDNSNEIKLEGGKNLLPFIKTEVKSGILEIENTNTCNFLRNNKKSITITIPAAQVSYINYQGFGELNSFEALKIDTLELQVREGGDMNLNLNTVHLQLVHAGFGSVGLQGTTRSFTCFYREFCQISAESFVADTLWVNSESSATGSFQVEKEATVRILGTGDVRILGAARVNLERASSGNLIRP